MTTATCNDVPCSSGWYTSTPVTLAFEATDGDSGVGEIRFSLDGSDPAEGAVFTGPIGLTETTTVRFAATDNVGHVEAAHSLTVRIDATPPSTPLLTVSGFDNAAERDGTIFFRAGAVGGFSVDAGSTDAESGIQSYGFPSLGDGWSNSAGAYSFSAVAEDPDEPLLVTATNGAGLPSETAFSVDADGEAPVTSVACDGGACSAGWYTSAPVLVSLAATDEGAGVARILYSLDGSEPALEYEEALELYATTTVRFAAVDRVGNVEATREHVVRIDTTAPSAPELALAAGANAYADGDTVFFRAGAAGGFSVDASSSDGESGIDAYGFPSLGDGWSNSGGAYSFDAGAEDPVEPNHITATNGAGVVSDPTGFTVTRDGTAPVSSIACESGACSGGWYTTAPVLVSLAAIDDGAGLDRILYSLDGSEPSLEYTGALELYATATVRFAALDKVGNVEATREQLVRIDTTKPTTPALGFSSFVNAADLGDTVYYRPGAAGTFTVTAASTDAQSGIEAFTYPSLGAGWSGNDGAYAFTATAADPDEPNDVTATNEAGLISDSTSFTVTPDADAPTTEIECNGAACTTGWYTTSTVSISLAALDSASGVQEIRYTTDGSEPSPIHGSVYVAPFDVFGASTVKYRAYDRVGNEEALGSQSIQIDSTPPSNPILAVSEDDEDSHAVGTTVYYNPSAGRSGEFTVAATAEDDGSGVASVLFPALDGAAGGGSDSDSPYEATYAWAATTTATGAHAVSAQNGAGLSSTSDVTVVPDTAPPTGGSVSYAGGYDGDGVIEVSTSDGTDAGAGIAASVLERQTAALVDGACEEFGAWEAVASPDTLASDLCARYRLRVTDNVGNEQIYDSANIVKVDAGVPSGPELTLVAASPYEYVDDTTLYYNPSGSNSGEFSVTATTSAASGIAKVAFPAIAGMSGGGDDTEGAYESTYAWTSATTAAGAQQVDAHSNAGRTASSEFTLVADTDGPAGGSVDYADGYDTTGTIAVATSAGTDAQAGLSAAAGVLERQVATLADGACSDFGEWAAASAPDTVASGLCVRYRFTVADRVGNETTYTSPNVVKVDTTAPTTPTLTFGGFASASASDGTVYFRAEGSGGFTATATSADPESGVAETNFPALGTGWTGSGGVYSFDDGAVDPTEPNIVVAVNRAGLPSAGAELTVTADGEGPSGGSVVYAGGWSTTASVALTLANGADDLSGVDETSEQLQRAGSTLTDGTCGSFGDFATLATDPSLAHVDTTATTGHCYAYRYVVRDNVGNETTYTTPAVARIDTEAPRAELADPGAYLRGAITLVSTQSDAASGIDTITYRYSPANGATWTETPASVDTALLADGLYDFQVVVRDRAGNVTHSAIVEDRRVDNTLPTVTLDDPGAYLTGSVAFVTAATDDGSGLASTALERSADGGATWTETPNPWLTTVADDGSYRFRRVAIDLAGNRAEAVVDERLVDNTAPTATMGVLPAQVGGTIALTSTTGDAGSGIADIRFERRSGGAGPWTETPASWDTTQGADGPYELHVIATDRAGHSTTSAAITTEVDNSEPGANIDSHPGNPTSSTSAGFSFSSTETGSTFECALDDAEAEPCTSPQAFAGPLAEGSHTFTVTATDAVGNESSDTYAWVVDVTAPDTTISSGPAASTTATTASFEFSSTEGGSTFTCVLDGVPETCTSPRDYPGLALGAHTFEVRATDAAGNQDAIPATHAWTVISAAPSVIAKTPAPDATDVVRTTNVTATFSLPMDAATLDTSTFMMSGPGGAVAASVAYDAATNTATLTPSAPLAGSATYTATLTTGARAATGPALAAPVSWSFTILAAPSGISTTPVNGAVDVSPEVQPSIVLSRAMDAASFTAASVTVRGPGGVAVSTNRTYVAGTNTLYIAPLWPLDYAKTYTVTLDTTVKAADGEPLAAPISWSFTTTSTGTTKRLNSGGPAYSTFSVDGSVSGGLQRTTANVITATDPTIYRDERYGSFTYTIKVPNGTYDVILHFAEWNATAVNTHVFSMDVLETTGTDLLNFDIFAAVGRNVATTRTIANVSTATSSIRVRSLPVAGKGDPTLAAVEVVAKPPAVSSMTPANGATGIARTGTTVRAVFSRAMDASTINASTFRLKRPDSTTWPATVTYDAATRTATLTPTGTLTGLTTFTAELTTGVRAADGLSLPPTTWTFTTRS
ncbi:MAG TPA: Ig-like domain-containing protein [Actinomycetota bacterium]